MYPIQNLCNGLARSVDEIRFLVGSDPKKAYVLLYKIVVHGIELTSFPEIQRNPLLAHVGEKARTLITNIDRLVWTHVAESTTLLSNVMRAVERRRPNYIMLCDGLSLPEYLFLIYMFHEYVRKGGVFAAANPSGMTSTFKYLAQNYLKILVPREEVIMRTVGAGLRDKFNTVDYNLFRDIDNFVHHDKSFHNIDDAIKRLSEIVYRLYAKTQRLLKTEHRVLLLADHGYDIVHENGEWKFIHGWDKDKLCMSPLVPILLFGVNT